VLDQQYKVYLEDGTYLVIDTPTGEMWSVYVVDADGQDRTRHLQPEIWEPTYEQALRSLKQWVSDHKDLVLCATAIRHVASSKEVEHA
jgi:hypothetical protein